MSREWNRGVRHIYGTAILFFYYMKWPILLGLPVLYFGLGYSDNPVLDILWILSLALVFKDLYVLISGRSKKGITKIQNHSNRKVEENDTDNTGNESQ